MPKRSVPFVIAAGALFGVVSWKSMNNIMHGKRKSLESTLEWQKTNMNMRLFEQAERTDYTIESFDGYILHATFLKNPLGAEQDPAAGDASQPAERYVILTHGYEGNRFRMLSYLRIFFEAGYHVILYDLRDHGENEPSFCTFSIREGRDLAAVIEDTYRRYGSSIFLGLHGESLGAATTIRSLMYPSDVKFAIADCGFADIENVIEGEFKAQHIPNLNYKLTAFMTKKKYGYSFDEMRPIDALAGNKVPLLFIHGANDRFILPINSRRMMQATDGYAEMHLIPGAAHANSVRTAPRMYEEIVKAFLKKVESGACDERSGPHDST